MSSVLLQKNAIVVRLHLIRHGETKGNAAGIVCGHMETSLNAKGIQQAKAASIAWGNFNEDKRHQNQNQLPNPSKEKYYWRTYSSDLSRAKETAEYVLDDPTSNLILDDRLREVAKGVKEGRSINLSYDEAMNEYLKEKSENDNTIENECLPKLETDTEVWERVRSWITDIVSDAVKEISSSVSKNVTTMKNEIEIPSEQKRLKTSPIIKNVFAASHSGTIRITVENLVLGQLPDRIRDKDGKFFSRSSQASNLNNVGFQNCAIGVEEKCKPRWKMMIPNTSMTVIDIIPSSSFLGDDKCKHYDEKKENSIWEAKLVKFASDEHLHGIQ